MKTPLKIDFTQFKGDLFIALKLTSICFVAVLLLSVMHLLTHKKIEQNNVKEINEANKVLIPEATKFEKQRFSSVSNDKEYFFKSYDDNDTLVGYTAVVLTSGYGGEMSLIVGFDNELAIKNVKLLTNSETPGVGKNAEKPHYMDKFIGTNTKSKPIPTKKSMLSQSDSDAVTGATITYNGITLGLIKASRLLRLETENKQQNPE